MPFPIGGPLEASISNGFRDIQRQMYNAMVGVILIPHSFGTNQFLIYDFL